MKRYARGILSGIFWIAIISIAILLQVGSSCGAQFPNAKPSMQFNNCIVNQIEGKDTVNITCSEQKNDTADTQNNEKDTPNGN